MRMRKKRNGAKRLEECGDLIIKSRADLPPLPVSLEIGCGKGGFICGIAARHPEKQFIAVEISSDVAVLAAERVTSLGLSNVHFIICDAKELTSFFDKGDVERIYLNFSDPWPKSGQHKRRLTYRAYLNVYKKILANCGSIIFKTDNRKLFDFSLDEMEFSGFDLRGITYDLHSSEFAEDNIITEYEKNFSARGFTINRVEAYLPEKASVRIRPATENDIGEYVSVIFDQAREYMRRNGIDQWQDGYPQKDVLLNDVSLSRAYVLEMNERPVAYAALCFGEEPTYAEIDGAWPDDLPYAAVHRVAVSKVCKGMQLAGDLFAEFELIAKERGLSELRCDTHIDNRSMRRTLEKNGFTECGVIRLANGDPRIAYYKHI